LADESHENLHNIKFNNVKKYQELEDRFGIHNDEQGLAIAVAGMIDSNFSKVPQSEIDEFVKNFDFYFSKIKNQIQVYK